MTLEQKAEMDRVVNRLRTSAARAIMTDEQRAAYNKRHREPMHERACQNGCSTIFATGFGNVFSTLRVMLLEGDTP